MFSRKSTTQNAEDALELAYQELLKHSPATEVYSTIVDRIQELEEIVHTKDKSNLVSPDTKAIVAANLAGIVMILGYEKANVITSKAFGLLLRTQ